MGFGSSDEGKVSGGDGDIWKGRQGGRGWMIATRKCIYNHTHHTTNTYTYIHIILGFLVRLLILVHEQSSGHYGGVFECENFIQLMYSWLDG